MATENTNELQTSNTSEVPVQKPTFVEAFRFWLKLGLVSFGGPTGQIAIMHAELVEKRRWISEERFLHALNFCMLLPGPEAQQLAILYRLVSSRHVRRSRRRRAVCPASGTDSLALKLALCVGRRRQLDQGNPLRAATCCCGDRRHRHFANR